MSELVVAWDCQRDAWLGAQSGLASLASRQRVADFVFLTDDLGALQAQRLRDDGHSVRELRWAQRLGASVGGSRARLLVDWARGVRSVLQTTADLAPSAYVANDLRSALILGTVARLRRRPVLWYLRGGEGFGIIGRVAYRLVDQVVAISEGSTKALGVPKPHGEKVLVSYRGVSIPPPMPARPSTSGDGSALSVVCVGALSPRKGQDVLIRSLHAASIAGGLAVELTLVGDEHGPKSVGFRALLSELAADLGVDTTFLGWQDAAGVAHALDVADVFALLSREEGLGYATLEAMARGLPTVVTRAGGSEETTIDGETGFVVGVEDVGAAAEAFLMLGEPQVRRRLGRGARRRCELVFDADGELSRFESVLSSLLRGGPHGG